MSRPISDVWFHRIKAATRDLVKACGGIVRAGEIAHASKSEVSRWQSAADADVITLPAVLALEADCGLALVTSVMADLNGQRLEHGELGGAAEIAGQQAEVMRHAAELLAQGAAALADGKISPAEAQILDRAAGDLERALAPMRRTLSHVAAPVLRAVEGGR